jgi:Ca-activated chloride channel family protein
VSFATPLALLALVVLPLALAGYLLVQRRRATYAVRFTNLDLLANIVNETPRWRRHVPPALYLASLGALLLALARPQWTIDVPREEATVVLVMDVSGSMLATDVEPSRLAAAQDASNHLLEKLPEGFNVSLVSFSNSVRIVVPATIDRETLRAGLARLEAIGGTAMGDGLMTGLDVIQDVDEATALAEAGANGDAAPTPSTAPDDDEDRDGKVPAVIVLLSDGQNTLGFFDPLDVADIAAERGVPIFTIALGTEFGVVDIEDPQSGRTRRVRVPPDEETLQEIADTTDASFYSAPTADELDSVYDQLGSKIGYDQEEREVTAIASAIAAVLLAAGGAFSLFWFNRLP